MPNLKEVQNNILLAYSADLIDEEKCVVIQYQSFKKHGS